MSDRTTRRGLLQVVGAAAVLGGCSAGDGGRRVSDGSAFPEGSCLAAKTGSLPDPVFGFEFSEGAAPEVGTQDVEVTGDVRVDGGTARFGRQGGHVLVESAPAFDDLTASLFARPAAKTGQQWGVMLLCFGWKQAWTGWGLGHGNRSVGFWAEGPRGQSSEVLASSDSGLSADRWAHLVAVKRDRRLVLYVDGQRVAETEFPYDGIDYRDADRIVLALGRHVQLGRTGSANMYYHGDLDSVAVWDEALSSARVEDLLSNGETCR